MKQFLLPFWEVFETLAVALVSIFILYTFIAQPFIVQGASMEPNFSNGDYILIDEVTYKFREPERGEVVVFKNPNNESEFYVKRIIGLPDEEIIISGEGIKVDGKFLKEEYLIGDYTVLGEQVFQLDNDEYFVMGDNRSQSYDSRSWGPLEKKEITGTVRLRFWPLEGFQIFRSNTNYTFS